jgi:Na+/H+-dicarboxylate symporter
MWFLSRFNRLSLSIKILIGMIAGILVGLAVKLLPETSWLNTFLINGVFDVIGQWFISLLKMIIVPIVFVSLVCSTCQFSHAKTLGRIGAKTLGLIVTFTLLAVLMSLALALLFHVGETSHIALPTQSNIPTPTSLKQLIINLVPSNPVRAMAEGNLLQLILFSLLFGIAIGLSGDVGKPIAKAFSALNKIIIILIGFIIKTAPYGTFCLMAVATASMGVALLSNLLLYCFVIILTLAIFNFGVYSLFLILWGRLNPIIFFKKMAASMLFAFSTSSSSATIPILLETAEEKLGVDNVVAPFVVMLGTTIHKSGCAIMQGVAVIFIANMYHIPLTGSIYFTIIITTMFAALSTSGVPAVGIFTLTMVLQQVGLPVEGIGLIIGVDRLLDMIRTSVSVAGVGVTACLVSKSEKTFNETMYRSQ